MQTFAFEETQGQAMVSHDHSFWNNVSYSTHLPEREGIDIVINMDWRISEVLGDPVVYSSVKWEYSVPRRNGPKATFKPIGTSKWVTAPIKGDLLDKIKPYNILLKADVVGANGFSINAGVIGKEKEASWNLTAAYNWDEFIFL